MTNLNLARIAKLIALFGFVLPWVLVSCSGQPVAHLTGIDLATGGLTNSDAADFARSHGHPNLWVLLSLFCVIAGLVASFLIKGRQGLVAMTSLAVVALVASAIGIATVGSEAESAPLQSPSQSSGDLLQTAPQYGYLITLAGLLGAIAAGGAALAGRGTSRDVTSP